VIQHDIWQMMMRALPTARWARARAWGARLRSETGAAEHAEMGQRGQEYAAIRLGFHIFLPHL